MGQASGGCDSPTDAQKTFRRIWRWTAFDFNLEISESHIITTGRCCFGSHLFGWRRFLRVAWLPVRLTFGLLSSVTFLV